jgi:SAM-dependent methyltransferase
MRLESRRASADGAAFNNAAPLLQIVPQSTGARPLLVRPRSPETRTPERLWHHYQVETVLAAKLRRANRRERMHLYSEIYDAVFAQVPDHPMLRLRPDGESTRDIAPQLAFLKRFLGRDEVFMEIGPGDCELSFAVCKGARHVHAIDVTDKVLQRRALPENFQLTLSDGCNIPLPDASVDVAFSNQLMEHLHPDDAIEQLRHISRALAPGGRYVCITPNRLYGPRDISEYFDEVATGLHLKEYTIGELAALFFAADFDRVAVYAGARGWYLRCPLWIARTVEQVLQRLPYRWRKSTVDNAPMRAFLGIRIVGFKAGSGVAL